MANGVSVDMGKSGTYLKKNEAMDEEANRILQAFSKDALVYLILFGIVPFYVIKEGDGRAVKVPPLGSGQMYMQIDQKTHLPSYLWFWTDCTTTLNRGMREPDKKMKFYEVNRPTSAGNLTSAASKLIEKYDYLRSLTYMFLENERKKVENEPIQQTQPPPLKKDEVAQFLDWDKMNNRNRQVSMLLEDSREESYVKRYKSVYNAPLTSLYEMQSDYFNTQSLDADLFDREERAQSLTQATDSASQVNGNRWGAYVKPVFKAFNQMDTGHIEKIREQFRADTARTVGYPIPAGSNSGSRALSEGISLERNYISSRINEYKLHYQNLFTAGYILVKEAELDLMDTLVDVKFNTKTSTKTNLKILLDPTIIISDSISRDISQLLIDDPTTYFEFAKALTNFDMEKQLASAGKPMPTFDSLKRLREEKKIANAPPEKKTKTK